MRDITDPWVIHEYDRRKFDFRGVVSDLLGCEPLESLSPGRQLPQFTRASDQHTAYHRMFYENFDRAVRDMYEAFIAGVIAPRFGTTFCYQTIPTFRVHLDGNVAVGEFHRDRDYNHQQAERNFWLPLTAAWDTNTVWIERADGEYRPATAVPGQIVQFDAVNSMHGNYPNDTGTTRVSFDFRCIPLDEYQETDKRSVNAGRRLAIGDYYKVYSESAGV